MTKQLKSLGQISDMILDLKLAALQQVSQNAEEVQQRIADMDAARQNRATALSSEASLDMAQLSGRDEAWDVWIQNARRTENIKLAKLFAEREERMAQARHALGRADVIKELMKKQPPKHSG